MHSAPTSCPRPSFSMAWAASSQKAVPFRVSRYCRSLTYTHAARSTCSFLLFPALPPPLQRLHSTIPFFWACCAACSCAPGKSSHDLRPRTHRGLQDNSEQWRGVWAAAVPSLHEAHSVLGAGGMPHQDIALGGKRSEGRQE